MGWSPLSGETLVLLRFCFQSLRHLLCHEWIILWIAPKRWRRFRTQHITSLVHCEVVVSSMPNCGSNKNFHMSPIWLDFQISVFRAQAHAYEKQKNKFLYSEKGCKMHNHSEKHPQLLTAGRVQRIQVYELISCCTTWVNKYTYRNENAFLFKFSVIEVLISIQEYIAHIPLVFEANTMNNLILHVRTLTYNFQSLNGLGYTSR